MSFLEKLGLGQKKRPSAPLIGEQKKKSDKESSFRSNIYIRTLIIVGFLVVLCFSIPRTSFNEKPAYTIGAPWKNEDLTAPFTFAIQKNKSEIDKEKEAVRQNTAPIFYRKKKVPIQVGAALDSLFKSMQPVLNAYKKWKGNDIAQSDKITQDSLAFIRQKNASKAILSDQAWAALLQNYQTTILQNRQADTKTVSPSSFIEDALHQDVSNILRSLLDDGIINQPKENVQHKQITVRNLQKNTEQTLNIANIRDIQQAEEYARYHIYKRYKSGIARAGIEMVQQVIRPNLIYNAEQTQSKIDEAISDISTSKGAIAKGQMIIRKGDIITQKKYNALQSLVEAHTRKASDKERWIEYGGDVIAIMAIVMIFFFYLYLYRRHIFKNNSMLLLVLFVTSLLCVASSLVYQFTDISLYIIPVAIAPIILTIIFDSRVGILSTVTLALLIGLINGNNFEFATATIVACCLGLFSVRDIKKRSQFFFITPGIVFMAYAVVIVSFSMHAFQGWDLLLHKLLFVGINAIFILFTYPLILLFEKTFNVTTDLALIELGDTNLPILKDLMHKAPGTFHHSLQVANLAEAAAGAIRANGLLCRVAALYHDIGKMENPSYFAENQVSINPHDKLKPQMSALVIKAHVTNGEKMAREEKLPELIINFIKTHHGTSVIKYFYEKAKENADEEKAEVREEDFRYDGPVPHTKETGIVMLADGIEAASRAMKEPNYQKLENLIDKMVRNRVKEGQLSKTPLTFQDLSVIKDTFLNILVGIYHSRVEYPEDEEETEKGLPAEKQEPSEEELPEQTQEPEDGSKTKVNDYYNS